MNGKIARKLVAAAVLLAASLTTGDVARQATKGDHVAAAAPTSATDTAKIPHYFGPYPNWANSPQVLADAVVTIGLGTPTPIAVGNPLTARANATDYATPLGVLGPVFTVLPNAVLPTGSLQSFQTWNQADGAGSPTPSAGGLFHAYVLRPTATPSQYTVVYDSGQLTVPQLTDPLVSELATFPVAPAVAVQAGDMLGFYGQGIPVDTGVTVNPDLFSYPATADTTLATNVAPALADTLTIGVDPGYPLYTTQDRTYSFSAMVTPTVVDPGTGAQATATVDPKTGAVSAVTVTSPGAGYVTTPNVSITSPGVTPTSLASATAQIATGVITGITVNEAGYGFTTPTVTITGGNPTVPAVGQASGGIDDIIVVNGGSGYLIQPIVEISLPDLPGGVQATATATMTNGVVDPTITVVNPGSGYTSAPTVTILDANAPVTTPGVAAVAAATIGISQIDITSGGQGYESAPTVAITDSVAPFDKFASATATVAAKGAVTGITVTAPGAGYLTPGLKKFVDTLPGLGPNAANNYGEYIPVAVPDTTTYPGADYYEIAVVQYRQQFSSQLPASLLRGYVQLSTSVVPGSSVPLTNANLDPKKPDTPIVGYTGVDTPHYLGPTIVATKDRPVRILFRNLLPTGVDGNLFLPVDTSLMGSGVGPDGMKLDTNGVPMDMAPDQGTVLDGVRNPVCGTDPKPTFCYTENRATLHMHGGITPWISDGTPHQWTTPAGETTDYPQGVSVSNVPDMPDPGPGALTFFYTNQQSARLMFYHDHAWGITRLNVYAGEAAGYLLTDDTEQSLISPTGAMAGLGTGTPLIVQDKTFVPSADKLAQQDPTWDSAKWGGLGNLWTPHVYMPAQNPADPSGMSSFGRWMYGPWFWPPAKDVKYPPIANPYYDANCDPNVQPFCEPPLIPSTPNVSVGMEAFNDTPIVNGTAYPTTTVDPKAYRYRILNAANDRFWNLSWYVADPTTGTLSEVALKANEVEAAQTDPNVFPTPDTAKSPAGPSWVQIGTEGGFLPTPVVVPSHPITWITDPTRFDVGNVDQHALLLAPAERADVIVDFSQYRGKTLILYNDAPAAFPARVAGYDYYTGGPDLSPAGAPTTLPGYGPNTRTIMQVKVSNGTPAVAFDRPNTTADRMGALMAAFGHHLDPVTNKPAGVFESGSDPIIVGQAAYNDVYGTNFASSAWCNSTTTPSAKCDGYARIAEGSQPTDVFKFDTLAGSQLQLPFQPKGIHDEMNSASFDEWGRMTANMGLEAPGATPLLQNIILYPYVNPSTENLDASGMPSSLDVTPITSGADGTQLWKITHNGVDTHPIHFHLYNVQVINRVTWDNIIIPPDPTELGWKDTVRVSPLEDTIVALRPIVPVLPFAVPDSNRPLNPAMPIGAHGDAASPLGTEAGFNNTDSTGTPINPIVNEVVNFGWEYVVHCHILSHEEMDMMRPVTVKVPWTVPPAPTGLTFTRGSVILSWTDPTPVNYSDPKTWNDSNQEIGFLIERAPVDGPNAGTFEKIVTAPATSTLPAKYLTAPANSTTFTYVPPDPTISYDYRVTAFNVAGTAPSNVVRVEGLPASPTTLTAVAGLDVTLTAGGKVVLDWTNVSPTATSVEVERAAGTGPFTLVDTVTPAPVGPGTYTDTSVAAAGPYSYRVRAVNAIGASAYSNVATVTIPLAASSTDLVSSQNPSTFGQSVTFTATVSSAAATATPGGSVQFFDGTTSLGTATMVAGVATFSTTGLSVGSHAITAQYGGDAIFATSTSPIVNQVVNPNATTTVVVSSGSPTLYGDPVTFTATVSPPTASGTVDFQDNGASIGSGLLVGGVATFQTSSLSVGSHPITAVYSGDATFTGSTGAVTQVVDLRTTVIAVGSSPNPSLQGSPVTFTATVTSALTTPIPGGSVSFFDGTTLLGTQQMTAGAATVTTSSLSAGSHNITAQYSGDASFAASTSPLLTQVVDLNATSTVVVSSGSPSLYGDAVTFTATVSPPTASGNVVFQDNGTSIGSGSLSLGVATFQTMSLSVGNHPITAVYGGDASFSGSTSAVTQVVNKGTTATAVGSSLNPSVEGDSVTFTANVTTLTGAGAPGGTVQFMDGAGNLGLAAAVSNGKATVTVTTLAAGAHSITAVYNGDVNFTGSTSSVLTQNVLRATSTVVTSNRTPAANLGQTITFTAQVRPTSGTGIPSGSVSFTIDGTITSPVLTLNLQGRATFQIATLSAGNHTVIATYGATTVFGGSTSTPITQVVNKAATTTTVTSNANPSVFGRSVTLTARVQPNPGAGINVQFFDGTTSLGSFPLDATGRARATTSTLSVGTHGITAVFAGNGNYVASTSPVFNETVNKANSRTVVTTSGSPANRNTPVTFTATVSAVAPGAGARTGSVQFRIDGTNVVPTVDLNASGQATMTTSTLAVGSHTVSAVYSGDGNFNVSTSANITQRIR